MKLARTSLLVLGIQLALVSSIAAKYLYQRNTCPRVWTRAVAYDPEMLMRGRYLSMQLKIDACGITLPIAKEQSKDSFEHRVIFEFDGSGTYETQLPIIVAAKNGKLVAERIAPSPHEHRSQDLILNQNAACSEAALQVPVDFYLSETAKSPFPLAKGTELWVEVTVPPAGPPRPIGLAIKSSDGTWQPLNYR